MPTKRFFDIFASLVGLVIFIFPGMFIAIMIKMTSTGPVFYRQKRIGRYGKIFNTVKFRTMMVGAETLGSITAANDKRITSIGKFLRRYKLDEFPQLWNVLSGRMSFVGPRPDIPGYADKMEGEARRILDLRPGITGPASFYFRNEEDLLAIARDPRKYNDEIIWPKKVELNLEYLNHWHFWKDIGYIIITIIPGLNKWCKLVDEGDMQNVERLKLNENHEKTPRR